MNYLSQYIDYFKYLCTQHPDLLHADSVGDRVFEVVAYEDAFSDFRTAAAEKAFFVRFILPTMRVERQSANARKVYQIGLMVGRYYSRREDTSDELKAAWTAAEHVADDFMARIVADSANGHPLFGSMTDSADRLNMTGDFWEVQGDGSWASVLYMFEVSAFRCVSPQGAGYANWADGGLTPL